MIKYLLITLSLFSSCAFAQSDYNKYCNSPKDQSTQMICSLSRQLGVSPLKVGAGLVFASIEMSGVYCNFGFSRKFLDSRIKLESDLDVTKVVKYLITAYSGKPPPGYTGDDRVFCKMQYETFGPYSKEQFFR